MVATSATEHLSIALVGHVDHGKSTLLGRLYADTGSLPEGKLEKVQAICRQQGKEFEYAFLFDAFLEEQEQGITIDTARTFFSWQDRQYIIIDAPGHKEFLKNMISGAARADAALLVIDADEGVQEQSKRHGYLLSLLGIRQIAVVVNKMDLVGYREEEYRQVEEEYQAFLAGIHVTPERFVPASAKLGDNIAQPSDRMPWYNGPTVLETLARFHKETPPDQAPLRLPLQDVYKFDARRILAGRLTAGALRVGDRLVFSPSNKAARVKSIEAFHVDRPPASAEAGQSIGLTLEEQIFVERGEIASHDDGAPLVGRSFRCNLFWMGRRPLTTGAEYALRLATREVPCQVLAVHRIIDAADLGAQELRETVRRNEVAELSIRTRSPIAFDRYADLPATGRFVLVDEYDVAGGGIITEVLSDELEDLREEARRRDRSWVQGEVWPEQRAEHYGHRAALVLVLGGDTSYQEALARRLEQVLVDDGRHAYFLEPDNLRAGLDADMVAADRHEVVRRFGEVARLLLDTGLIVVCPLHGLEDEDYRAVQTLVHPVPVLMARIGAGAPLETDVRLGDDVPVEDACGRIVEELKSRSLLALALNEKRRFRYANYSI
ncbi:MAG: GTP-binding protein [Chloroflexi bacterium]|nr:GTP-binding protein [Chloroflexota bacterium]